jgi:hypothetical protein
MFVTKGLKETHRAGNVMVTNRKQSIKAATRRTSDGFLLISSTHCHRVSKSALASNDLNMAEIALPLEQFM